MHLVGTCAALALAALASAQSPLALNFNGATFIGGNTGNTGNAVYFDLTVNTTVTITSLDLNCGQGGTTPPPVGTAGSVDVFLGPTTAVGNQTNSGLWTPVANAPLITGAVNALTNAVFPGGGFGLGPGHYGVCLKANGYQNAYTNPGTGGSSATASTAELTISAGSASNVPFTAPVFSPRLTNIRINYTNGGTPVAVASWQGYGKGCYGRYTSFHEIWGNPLSFDLQNTNIHFAFGGAVYAVSITPASFFTPVSAPLAVVSGSPFPQATPFALVYPSAGGVGVTNSIDIHEDGWIAPVSSTADQTPTEPEFYSGVTRWAPYWKDQTVSLGGTINFDLDPSGTVFYVTWNAVRDSNISGSTSTSTYQVAFFQNGDVEYRYQTMSTNGGGSLPTIVGWTQGNGALDRGPIDITVDLPLVTDASDNAPIVLAMSARPQLGTTPQFQTSGIPAATTIVGLLFSFVQVNPGQDLGFLGAGGCSAYLQLGTLVNGPLAIGPFPSGTTSAPLNIPVLPALNGTLVFAQSASFTPGFNSLGVLTTNGVRMVVGQL